MFVVCCLLRVVYYSLASVCCLMCVLAMCVDARSVLCVSFVVWCVLCGVMIVVCRSLCIVG